MRNINAVIRNSRPLMQRQRLLVLLTAVTLVSISAGPSLSVARSEGTQSVVVPQTTTVTMLPGTTQAIKVGPGNQTNPHVDCNLVSYTEVDDLFATSQINYFDFATNTNQVVPGNGIDLLSEISGNHIAFTEVHSDGDHVAIFDTVAQTTTFVPSARRSNPSIGGNLVAFEDQSFSADLLSEISISDQSTGTVTRLTNDALDDKNPEVSPTGNAVVWEKCQGNGTGCDVYLATSTGPGTFATRVLTGAGEDRRPYTDGQIVVYTSDKSGENDIYFQRVDGSTEMHLAIPGDQRDVTVAGNLIAFESQASNSPEYDIFVYDLRSGNLYQATNTPLLDESLSAISTCDGIGRVVYVVPAEGAFDVYAFTFQVPSSTANQIDDLIALVKSFNLPAGTANSLITKLQDAQAAIGASDTATACDFLTAFINACQGQSGKKLTAAQASQLINSATLIKTNLGC